MITLLDNYYKMDSWVTEGDDTLFSVTLLPEYRAYKGHFPGNPISPGVCNIQMIKECAEQLAGKRLFLSYISQCRFSVVITPQTTPRLQIRMQLSEVEDMYKIRAIIFDNTANYIDFKGEFTLMK